MPSKVINLRPTVNLDQLMQRLPDNDPTAWMMNTKQPRQAVDAPNFFRKYCRTLQEACTIAVLCIEQEEQDGRLAKWAKREYEVVSVDLTAQVVEVVALGEWREFSRAPTQAQVPHPEPKRARA